MKDYRDLPLLDIPVKCASLWNRYSEKVIGLWAANTLRQNVDVLWRLRQELRKNNVPVVFFFQGNALSMLFPILEREGESANLDDVYQLDNYRLFRLLPFVDLLVSNDYVITAMMARSIRAKLVCLPHSANTMRPHFYNVFFDYFISRKNRVNINFDFGLFPDSIKIHRNSHFSHLLAGDPKIDLVLEESLKVYHPASTPRILLELIS